MNIFVKEGNGAKSIVIISPTSGTSSPRTGSSWKFCELLTFTSTFWGAWQEMCDKKKMELWNTCNLLLLRKTFLLYLSQDPWVFFFIENNMAVVPHLPRFPDLAIVTLSCSPKWNWSWRGAISTESMSKRNRRWFLCDFHGKNFCSASEHGRDVWIAVQRGLFRMGRRLI